MQQGQRVCNKQSMQREEMHILRHTLTRRVLHRAHPVRLLEWNLLLAGIRRNSYLVQAWRDRIKLGEGHSRG